METKKSKVYDSFQIVRHVGTPKQGTLPDGTIVYAQDKFWIDEPPGPGFIKCIEDDQHFLYKIPDEVQSLYPGPIYRCSCGGAGIYVGLRGYVFGASPQGLLFVCQHHITTGFHATGGSRWI